MSPSQFRGYAVIIFCLIGLCLLHQPPSTSAAATQAKPTIKIGAVLSLSGPAEEWGQNARNGITLAVDELNNAGGINGSQVEVLYRDCVTNENKAKDALNSLLSEGVQAVIGDVTSTCVRAMTEIANKHEVVLITPGASHPDISKRGDFVFRYWYSDELEGKADAIYAKESLKWQRVVTLYINIAYGKGINEVFVREFKAKKGEVIRQIPFELKQNDFGPQVTQLLQETNPDGLFLVGYKNETIAILKQLKKKFEETGKSVPILSTQAFHNLSIIRDSEGAAEGVVFSVPRPPDQSNTRAAAFREAYRQRYGKDLDEDPADFSDTSYDSLMIIAEALKRGNTTGPRIREYIEALENYRGAVGDVTFNANGDVPREFAFKQVTNGKFKLLGYDQPAAMPPAGGGPAGQSWWDNTAARIVGTLVGSGMVLLLGWFISRLAFRFWFSAWQWWRWQGATFWFRRRMRANKSGRKIVTLKDYVDLLEKLRELIVKRCDNLQNNEKSEITIYSYTMQLLRDWPMSEVSLEQVQQSPTPLEQYFINFDVFKKGSETQKYDVKLKRVIVIDACEGPNGKAKLAQLIEDVSNNRYYEKYIEILHTGEADAYYYEHQRPWPGWLTDSVFYAIKEPGRSRRWLWGVTTSYNVGEDLIILRLHRLGKRKRDLDENLSLPFRVSTLDELAEMADRYMRLRPLSSLKRAASAPESGDGTARPVAEPPSTNPPSQNAVTVPEKE